METWLKEVRTKEGALFYELPAFVDFHLHPGWTDFDHEEQKKRSREEIKQRIAFYMEEMAKMGFGLLRDAGGMETDEAREAAGAFGRSLLPCCGMLNRENAQAAVYDSGFIKRGNWVKIFATGGIGAPANRVLVPMMDRETFFRLTDSCHRAGVRVMVHTWGGESLDWSIEAGADSVEHGVYMTRRQAYGLAKRNILYVPTAAVYQVISSKENPMKVPAFLAERSRYAAQQHQKALRYALSEGVRLGCGTDFYADPALLPYEYEELFALQDYGVPTALAWEAFCGGTLTKEETGGAVQTSTVLLRRHPFQIPSAKALREAVVQNKENV